MANKINLKESYSKRYWKTPSLTIDSVGGFEIQYYTSNLKSRVQIYDSNKINL